MTGCGRFGWRCGSKLDIYIKPLGGRVCRRQFLHALMHGGSANERWLTLLVTTMLTTLTTMLTT
jgi:hypothetical protein